MATRKPPSALPAVGFIAVLIIGATVGIFYLVTTSSASAKAARKAAEEEAKKAAAATQQQQRVVAPVEALVLEHECLTPCGSFVGWNYKVRTDGHPFRIKYQGTGWVKGGDKVPETFEPGEAEFVSDDSNNLHVLVQVYKKITVPRGQ